MLPRRGRAALDGLTLGHMSLSHLGGKAAAAVRTLDVVWVFHRWDGRQVGGVATFGDDLLGLSCLAQGLDETLVLLSPVALPRSFGLQRKREG